MIIIQYYHFLTIMQPYTIIIYEKLFHLHYSKTIPCRFILFKSLEISINTVGQTAPTIIYKHSTDKSTQYKNNFYIH